ncbi:hypothetical protein GCM10023350_26470 [Nocardioides endophyticus]|uniref:Uncharacterized protein n=1 Tax=Nocardioides endophyticus TaxID=1353775 RepID=A0ABP8YYU7_9ACTN
MAWFDEAELQSTVDRWRDAADQLRRPLRIGDTFWVRGYSPSSAEGWADLRDVTIHARAMAKAGVALVARAAPVLPPRRADRPLSGSRRVHRGGLGRSGELGDQRRLRQAPLQPTPTRGRWR